MDATYQPTAKLDSAINEAGWNRYADLKRRAEAPTHVSAKFEWAQFPGHQPHQELFGQINGTEIVELGCGSGNHLAFLASLGAPGTGVDVSNIQLQRARERWSNRFSTLRFVQGDAAELTSVLGVESADVIYSVFGAVSHCSPRTLFPQIYQCLRPAGRLLFSVRHPQWPAGEQSPQHATMGRRVLNLQLDNDESTDIVQYDYSKTDWGRFLREAAFSLDHAIYLFADADELKSRTHPLPELAEMATAVPCSMVFVATKQA